MKQICIWHGFKKEGKYGLLPAYYIEDDYAPVAVRVYAEQAPYITDAEFDIYADGVSVFENRSSPEYYQMGGVRVAADDITYATLSKDSNQEEFTGNLKNNSVPAGTWLTCNLITDGGGRNFTIQLDLEKI